MDPLEATNMLLSKIMSMEPENARKIMGYIMIQDLKERDLLRLALGPETVLQNVILNAKTHLGLVSNSFSTPNSPSPLNHFAPRPSNNSHNPLSQSSPRVVGDGSFSDFGRNPSPGTHSWLGSDTLSPKSSPFLSYDNIRFGSALVPPFLKNGGDASGADCSDGGNSGVDLLEGPRLDDYFSFLDDSSLKSEDFMDQRVQLGDFPVNNGDAHLHRRRFSESDAFFGVEDGSLAVGLRPCLYHARGFCKNGDGCPFVHGGSGGSFEEVSGGGGGGAMVGSPREMESLYLQQQQEEMMRMKVAQQQHQRLAYNKYLNLLLQQQNDYQRFRTAPMGDELHKLGRPGSERNDFLAMVMADKASSASRQIYLTFPADSTFKDEDVSNYFSTYGPVQDVRIPYQQKRMFGFVTFVHSETVKQILSRGNPHFICDSRVLVKPYKEKGKVAIERQHQLQQQVMERGSFLPSSSPSGLDPRELYEFHLGARVSCNPQEMMLRRKLEEQAELQQAIELQGRRMIDLKLPDMRGDYVPHHHRSLSVGSPISLANHTPINQNIIPTSDRKNHEAPAENPGRSNSTPIAAPEKKFEDGVIVSCAQNNGADDEKVNCQESCDLEGRDANERDGNNVEKACADSVFASPRDQSCNEQSSISPASVEIKECGEVAVTVSSKNNAASSTDGASS